MPISHPHPTEIANTMNHLKVSTRLTLLVGFLCVLLVASGGLSLFSAAESDAALRSVYEDRTVPTQQLGAINALLLHNRLAISAAILEPTPEVIAERGRQIDANVEKASALWSAYAATRMTGEEQALATAFAEERRRFLQEGLLPAVQALRQGRLEDTRRLLIERMRPLSAAMERDLDRLGRLQVDEARQDYTSAEARNARLRVLTISVTLAALAIAAVSGWWLVRAIVHELGAEPAQAADLARRVAAGDLNVAVTLRDGDTRSLMAQLQAMQVNLRRVVSDVRQNSDSVATASAQIAQGNGDLSSRTEHQASALQQTAASMEQLSTTVRQNADNAGEADRLARGASEIARQGGDVVERAVATMKGINDSSRRIADIIGVIDGIAFQTNILALNAAVEAARAGESGRGFAVVAGEVRGLAKRSADAAREIKSLIHASVDRVESGTQLVDQMGSTMNDIVGSIGRVAAIVGEISTASAEQSSGVAQVGEAIRQMDDVTQQNAALVEQSAAAADSLRQQADKLVQAVAVFRLAGA